MPIKLLSSGGGSVIVNATSTGSNFTVNVPAVNGNIVTTADTGTITQAMLGSGVYAGYGPAFSAYTLSIQSVSNNTNTKIVFDVKEYDTASCFSTSTYRFTPNVAGYYMFMMSLRLNGNIPSYFDTWVYKNGSQYQRDRKSTRLNSSHSQQSRMPSSA